MRHVIGFVLFSAMMAAAPAGAVTFNETKNQTVDGQNFLFNFAGAPAHAGGGGTLVVHARGDFGDNSGLAGEDLDLNAETFFALLGRFNLDGTVGIGGPFDFVTAHTPSRDYEFQRSYSLDAAAVAAIVADGSINVLVDLGSSVNFFAFEAQPYVEITFTYNVVATDVVEPATLALLGAGLFGLAHVGRRRAKPASHCTA